MMRRYPDRLTIQIPGSGGSRDPVSGRWIPAPATVIYDGPCLAQDEGVVLEWSNGLPSLTSDVSVGLPPRLAKRVISKIAPRQTAKLLWGRDGALVDAEVERARRIGSKVFLKYV